MGTDHTQLPSWLAHAAARATPPDGAPAVADAVALAQAWLEYGTLMLLSDALDRDPVPALSLERAMRVAMAAQMDHEEWRVLLEALLLDPAGERVLGCDAAEVNEHVGRLRDMDEAGAAALVDATLALVGRSPATKSHPLCAIHGVDGGRVRFRRFVGTLPAVPEDESPDELPELTPGTLAFWDLGARVVPVPDWLAFYDVEHGVVRLYGGREQGSRQWLYASRVGEVPVHRIARPRPGTPVILSEPTWATPPPARRRASRNPAFDETQHNLDEEALRQIVAELEAEHTDDPVAPAPPTGPRWVLRVLNGRGLMRYVEFGPHESVVIGRNPAFADLAVYHGEVSRSHTRVWATPAGKVCVRDLGSTNGTFRNGVPVSMDKEGEPLVTGDTLGLGKTILVQLEWAMPELVAKLQRLKRLQDASDHRQDPLTHLLKPRALLDVLAAELERGFASAPVSGALLTIDRISQLHAQHGQAVADTVFHTIATIVLYSAPEDAQCVRVGYGEILVVLVGHDADKAHVTATRLKQACADHVVDAHARELTLTASVGERGADETIEAWVTRLRQALQEGRSSRGRSRVFQA